MLDLEALRGGISAKIRPSAAKRFKGAIMNFETISTAKTKERYRFKLVATASLDAYGRAEEELVICRTDKKKVVERKWLELLMAQAAIEKLGLDREDDEGEDDFLLERCFKSVMESSTEFNSEERAFNFLRDWPRDVDQWDWAGIDSMLLIEMIDGEAVEKRAILTAEQEELLEGFEEKIGFHMSWSEIDEESTATHERLMKTLD